MLAGLNRFWHNQKIAKTYQNAKPSLLFIGKIILIYLAWKAWLLFIGTEAMPVEERYWPWLSAQWESFNDLVRVNLIHLTSWLLELGGITTTPGDYKLGIASTNGMRVGNYCLALQLWFFFAGIVLVFPAPLRHKLWFIPLGILLIHFMNVLRMVSLGGLLVHAPAYFDVNHYYILRGVVLVAIFMISYPFLKHFASYDLLSYR